MNQRIFTRMSATPIILALFLLIFAPFTITITSAEVTELNVNPEVVGQGGTLSISGKAPPNEKVELKSSFAISLPVLEGGKYSRDFIGIHFPAGEKIFSVTAEKIKNIRISLETVEVFKNATNGIATISVPFPIPTQFGPIDISVYGDAAEDATSVNLNVATSIKVPADSNGYFELDINTEGVPLGEFLITAGGIEKTVEVVSEEQTPTPTPSPSPTPTPSSNGGDGDGAPDTTPTPTPTPSASPSPSPTPTPSPSPTRSPSPLTSPSPTPALTTTPTPSAPAPTPSPTPSPSSSKRRIQGFEAIFAIAGLLAVAYLVLRKRE